ncbi:DUF1775 domain-containing protein [Terrilactibacillus sp. S3-3]|nr:DUF1775 domain-containing protein [Terrilactibacillus sp. S3-3]
MKKINPTLKIVLKAPKGIEFESYEPVAGWKTTTQKDANGKVTSVTWTATKGGIQPGQFQAFNFIAKNPAKETTLAWNATNIIKIRALSNGPAMKNRKHHTQPL